MRLFAPDLYRSFAIGFIAGGLMIGATAIDNWQSFNAEIAPAAQAAEAPSPTADISSEFVIADWDVETE